MWKSSAKFMRCGSQILLCANLLSRVCSFCALLAHFEAITNWDLLVLIHLLNIRSVGSSAMNTWQAEVMLIYELMTRPEIHLSKEERDRVVRNWRTVGRLNLSNSNNMWNELSSGEFFFNFVVFYSRYFTISIIKYMSFGTENDSPEREFFSL